MRGGCVVNRCLDTTFLSDLIRSDPNAIGLARKWAGEGDRLATTAVNWFEVELGIALERSKSRRRKLAEAWTKLSSSLDCGLLTRPAAETAASRQAELLARGRPAPFRDLFVAAIALSEGYEVVVTKDKAAFDRIGLVDAQRH